MKRGLVVFMIFILVVLALAYFIPRMTGSTIYSPNKIKINVLQESVVPGENLSFSIEAYDDANNQINKEIDVFIEDVNRNIKIEKKVQSGKEESIMLDKNAQFGYWKLIARYTDDAGNKIEDYYLFNVEIKENVKFSLDNDVLTITNLGNSVYEKTVQIAIGDTIGTKNVKLEIGESTNLRLTAPEGNYNIKISDGKNTLTRSDVALTGNAIGILDSRSTNTNDITSGINPKDSSFVAVVKNKSIVYLFLAIIAGAAILLAIERNYRRKLGKWDKNKERAK